MKVEKLVEVPASKIYDLMVASLISDYEEATKEKLKKSEVKEALTYVKHFGKDKTQSVRVRVNELVENETYKVSISSNRGLQEISYQLKDEEEGTRVLFEEEYLPSNRFYRWNYQLLFPFFKRSLEKRMLLQIQKLAEFANQ